MSKVMTMAWPSMTSDTLCGCREIRHVYHDGCVRIRTIRHDGKVLRDEHCGEHEAFEV